MQVRLTKEQKVKIANADDVYEIMRTILMRENKLARQKEHFWVIGLSHSNVILYVELVALGTINEVMVKPVEVFNFAVIKKAIKIILVHNHPSGELRASEQDIRITQRLKAGADALEIEILDHFIISEKGYVGINL